MPFWRRERVYTALERWTKIRLEVLRGETSKRAILRRENIHWETLKKILQYPEPLGYLTNEQVQDATGHASAAFKRYFQGEQKRAIRATETLVRLCKQPVNNIPEELKPDKLLKLIY
jgi:hypothetical protein